MMAAGLVPLDLINDVRERLDDVKTHSGSPPAGMTYRWEAYDDDLLWRNAELMGYLNNALLEIGLRHPVEDDTTGEVVEIELVPGQLHYQYSPCILAIDHITLRSEDYPLYKSTRRTRERFRYGRRRPLTLAPGVPEQLAYGPPVSYYEDSRERQIVIDTPPLVRDHLDLMVRRLFISEACWASRCQPLPEPGPQYREAILQWMLSRAYSKRNCDQFDGNAAVRAEREFQRIVGPPVSLETWDRRRLNANLTMRVGPKSYPGWRRPTYPYRYRW